MLPGREESAVGGNSRDGQRARRSSQEGARRRDRWRNTDLDQFASPAAAELIGPGVIRIDQTVAAGGV
jgi:hypothetical protein